MLAELLGRLEALVIDLRLLRGDLVEQLALAVLLPSLRVDLRDRDRLADTAPALCADHHETGARRTLQNLLPLLGGEVGFASHACLLVSIRRYTGHTND